MWRLAGFLEVMRSQTVKKQSCLLLRRLRHLGVSYLSACPLFYPNKGFNATKNTLFGCVCPSEASDGRRRRCQYTHLTREGLRASSFSFRFKARYEPRRKCRWMRTARPEVDSSTPRRELTGHRGYPSMNCRVVDPCGAS